jgi:diguanylate cyclase (GGDEF)-like protein
LMACFCMLVTVFAAMLIALRALHPRLPGIGSVTLGFSTGAIATTLLFAEGRIPAGIAVAGGGAMTFVSSIFLYRGILQFCGHQQPASGAGDLPDEGDAGKACRNYLPQLCVVSVAAFAVVAWFTVMTPREAVRVVAIAGTMALARWLMCWTMLGAARGRMHLRALGIMFGVVAVVTTGQALGGALFAGTRHSFAPVHLETPTLLFAVLVACIQGVFFLMMFGGMLTESIHEQAQRDYLTGILNRRGIEAALDSEMARTRRARVCFSMLLIDVDHFKAINDRCGHACGDESLRLVAQTVLRTVRIYDRLGRFGGDEFMLLLPQTDSAEAMATASRIIAEIRKLPQAAKGLPITVSIGATCCWSAGDPLAVTTRADAALYEAKRSGRDCAQLNLGSITHATRASDLIDVANNVEHDARPVLVPDHSLPSEA